MSAGMFAVGVLLVIAAVVVAVIATIQGSWLVFTAMAVCAATVGVQLGDR